MAISGPIALYNNLPIEPQYYQPSRFVISNIALGVMTTITTTLNMNYVIGQLVKLIVPPSFGCRQLNERQGYVISIPTANQVILSIDSSQNVDPYVASTLTTVAQILAIGDVNQGQINTGRSNNLIYPLGAFINISPI
jgi:hypothetical protein